MKRLPLISLVLFPLVLLIGGLYFCAEKSGSKIHKFAFDIPYQPQWETSSAPPSNEILSQKFHYLKGGSQCYTFMSEDQHFVIKFFKKNHILPKYWLNYIPFPFLENYRYQKVDKHKERQQETFLSYKMAYDELREETGLLYVHLNKTNVLKRKITLVMRDEKEDQIDLDRVSFILQKKAELLTTKIAKCRTPDELQKISDSILNLVSLRCKKGLIDLDGDISKNFGFIGDQAIQFDVGRVVLDDSIKDPSKINQELARVEGKLEDLYFQYLPNVTK